MTTLTQTCLPKQITCDNVATPHCDASQDAGEEYMHDDVTRRLACMSRNDHWTANGDTCVPFPINITKVVLAFTMQLPINKENN